MLEDTRGSLQVLLLGEDSYCTTQAAVYLASLSHSRENLPHNWEKDDPWGGVYFGGLDELEEPDSPDVLLSRSLAVVSPEALDPALRQKKPHGPAVAAGGSEGPVLSLRSLTAPAALITAGNGKGPHARRAGAGEIEPLDILIALKSTQVDPELLEELHFTCGFQVARVGRPDQDYYRRFLRSCGESLLCPIDTLADLDRVITHTRRLWGDRFLRAGPGVPDLLGCPAPCPAPLRTQDLLFPPPSRARTAAGRT